MSTSATIQKNLALAVDALTIARQEALDIAVEVTCAMADLPSKLQTQIAEARLIEEDYLRLSGTQTRASVRESLVKADGCLLLSWSESFCHPAVEAMAVGCPLVCADRPWARDLCGQSAYFVDPSRPLELVQVWRNWRENKPSVPELADVVNRFSWQSHIDCLVDCLVRPVSDVSHEGQML